LSAVSDIDGPLRSDRPDPAYPALRPFDLETLREAVDAKGLSVRAYDNMHAWGPFLRLLRAERGEAATLTRVLSWALAETDLIWWACLAARFEETLSRRRSVSEALVLAQRWLRERDEAVRYRAFDLAQQETKPTAGTLAAYAVFAAGPSLAPRDAPAAAPPPGVARGAASGALMAAASAPAMAATGLGFDLVNRIGLEIAAGRDGRAAARGALNLVSPDALGVGAA
jgi:hypothetical protein